MVKRLGRKASPTRPTSAPVATFRQVEPNVKQKGRPFDWLLDMTGRSRAWWYAYVQSRIAAHTVSNPADKDHGMTDANRWLAEVADMAVATMPADGRYDGNMRSALVLSYVLGLWYFRLHHAKIHDARRPIAIRQSAYLQWLDNVSAFALIPVDSSDDAAYFGGQDFESPYSPAAHDGKFV